MTGSIASNDVDTHREPAFEPLFHAGEEVRGIGLLFEEVFGVECTALVLEERHASRAALEEVASRATYLHIATHGWYASESIGSRSDARPFGASSGLEPRTSGEKHVPGMSPLELVGLALAGANLSEDAHGRVTGQGIAALDLSNCELAVLSCCDASLGVRRAGQGAASLQRALQMAGARSVITSLWRVPDVATCELMLDFYRRIWAEKKPNHQALWEAKRVLREKRDEHGALVYGLRDWAAWVLTGEPD